MQSTYGDLDVDDKDEVAEGEDGPKHHAEEGIISIHQLRVHVMSERDHNAVLHSEQHQVDQRTQHIHVLHTNTDTAR